MINLTMLYSVRDFIYTDISELPHSQAVLVLGAKVYPGRLSSVLRQRVNTGVQVYQAEKADKILLSGDHGQADYDEVNTMREYIYDSFPGQAAEADVFMDHAGFDTYDSMYRAREIFGVKSMIIVTQRFHVARAVYIARSLGINAVGIALDEESYSKRNILVWNLRESLGRSKSFFDVLFDAQPEFLGKEIPITGDGRLSWD